MNDSFRPQKLFTIDDIITQDPVMIELKQNISHVAMTNSSVLIYGETGTGKELVAQSIHSASRRSGKPLCGSKLRSHPEHFAGEPFVWNSKGKLYRRGKQKRVV